MNVADAVKIYLSSQNVQCVIGPLGVKEQIPPFLFARRIDRSFLPLNLSPELSAVAHEAAAKSLLSWFELHCDRMISISTRPVEDPSRSICRPRDMAQLDTIPADSGCGF